MQPRAWFQCIKGCPGELPLTDVVYECPTCGSLLEVTHDIQELKKQSSAAWTRMFDARYKRTTWPYGSGVWGKKEWVAPHVRDENVVSMYENMKAKDAAKIFDRLDMKVLVEVATQLNPRRMSDVLAQMSPEAAERLTVELAARPKDKSNPADLPKIEGRPLAN